LKEKEKICTTVELWLYWLRVPEHILFKVAVSLTEQ